MITFRFSSTITEILIGVDVSRECTGYTYTCTINLCSCGWQCTGFTYTNIVDICWCGWQCTGFTYTNIVDICWCGWQCTGFTYTNIDKTKIYLYLYTIIQPDDSRKQKYIFIYILSYNLTTVQNKNISLSIYYHTT